MKRAIYTISLLVGLLFVIPVVFLSTSQAFSGWLTNPREEVTNLQAQKQSRAASKSDSSKFSSKLADGGVVISNSKAQPVSSNNTVAMPKSSKSYSQTQSDYSDGKGNARVSQNEHQSSEISVNTDSQSHASSNSETTNTSSDMGNSETTSSITSSSSAVTSSDSSSSSQNSSSSTSSSSNNSSSNNSSSDKPSSSETSSNNNDSNSSSNISSSDSANDTESSEITDPDVPSEISSSKPDTAISAID